MIIIVSLVKKLLDVMAGLSERENFPSITFYGPN